MGSDSFPPTVAHTKSRSFSNIDIETETKTEKDHNSGIEGKTIQLRAPPACIFGGFDVNKSDGPLKTSKIQWRIPACHV